MCPQFEGSVKRGSTVCSLKHQIRCLKLQAWKITALNVFV